MGAHPDARGTVLGVQSASRDSERVDWDIRGRVNSRARWGAKWRMPTPADLTANTTRRRAVGYWAFVAERLRVTNHERSDKCDVLCGKLEDGRT